MSESPVNFAAASELLRAVLDGSPRGASAALADELGVARQTVSKWVTGAVPLPVSRWLAVEDALGLAPLAFAEHTGLADAMPHLRDANGSSLVAIWASLFGADPNVPRGVSMLGHPSSYGEPSRRAPQMPTTVGDVVDVIDGLDERISRRLDDLDRQVRGLSRAVARLARIAELDDLDELLADLAPTPDVPPARPGGA